jgi:hypothetical protein
MDKPLGNLVFGYQLPKDIVEKSIKEDKDYKTKFIMTEIIDYCRIIYPMIEKAELPFNLELRNENNSKLSLDFIRLSISLLTFKFDTNFMELWEKINDLYNFISEKLKIEEVSNFGMRQICIIDKEYFRESNDNSYSDILKSCKIIDEKTESLFHSNVFRFKKPGKIYNLRIEPYLDDSEKTYIDFDANYQKEMPIKDINELMRQEISFFKKIIYNITRNKHGAK